MNENVGCLLKVGDLLAQIGEQLQHNLQYDDPSQTLPLEHKLPCRHVLPQLKRRACLVA